MDKKGPLPGEQWSPELFSALTEHSADIISLLDAQGRLLFNSSAAERISGFSAAELTGVNTFELIHPDDREGVANCLLEVLATPGAQSVVQYRYRHKSGGWTWMEAVATNQLDNPVVRGLVANSRDITERRRLEEERQRLAEQVVRGRSLESLGTLAGGMAHDFNNLLAVILGETELMREGLSPQAQRTALQNIASSARRAAELTLMLLAYAGRGRYRHEPVDLLTLVANLETVLRATLRPDAILSLQLEPNTPPIDAEGDKLSQVLLSLIANASEALNAPAGQVTVRVGCRTLTPQMQLGAAFGAEASASAAVFLEVEDNGCGMDNDVLARIFEPFFSTKETGRGLGLAAVAGIVRGLNGTILVKSQPTAGACFTLYFPPSKATVPSIAPEPWKGSGLALVVDDDAQTASVTARMLAMLGFTTATARDGMEALELFGGRLAEVRLVVLDMIMPRLSGSQTFLRLRQLRPELPVLFYSGYPGDVAQEELRAPLTRFISKPFTRDALTTSLRSLLDE
jgi:two-component system cell cycle sensor histidine kinase/response regulator CckA